MVTVAYGRIFRDRDRDRETETGLPLVEGKCSMHVEVPASWGEASEPWWHFPS